jgi:RecA-family ATPase
MNHVDEIDYDQVAIDALGAVQSSLGLKLINPTTLFGRHVPPRRWIVEDWLPVGHVTINYGDGGVGKTLLAQQLATGCATGTPWCGLAVQKCRVLGLFCEDEPDEMHRRQDRINASLGLNFGDLGNLTWASGVGDDNALIRFDRDGTFQLTQRFEDLKSAAKTLGARLVIIDTAADTFTGNENDRGQVRQFIGHVLTGLAQHIDGAVLLNAHPSRSGMSRNGDMDGGSTGWSNSARSRWSLTRPVTEDGEVADDTARVLTRRKANYASIGDTVRLQWREGVLMPPQGSMDRFTSAGRQRDCEALFLIMLDRCEAQGRPLSSSRNAGNFAPKVCEKAPDREGYVGRDFDRAMEALFTAGIIESRPYGKPSRGTVKIARVAPADPAGPTDASQ